MGRAGGEAAGLGDRASFSLSRPDPSLKSNTMLQSLSLRMSTGVLSPETSLNMGVGVRNSGGSGPERALNSFIQNLPSNTKRPNRAALECNNRPFAFRDRAIFYPPPPPLLSPPPLPLL